MTSDSTRGPVPFSIRELSEWWRTSVIGTVNQEGIVELRREDADPSARFVFMTLMSAGIAILGLILSSPAVVIGAMLIAPLMGPIIGLGFAMATGDYVWLRKCARSIAVGALLGVAFCALIVWLSPLKTVTSEIAARTRPNLFDLLVALFSGMAGAYALIRGREGAVVGVAIATALMPPLAVVGFGLATLNWTVFSGALLLFVTNLVAIALTAAVMARLYGFTTALSERQSRAQNALIVIALLALAVPLGIALRQIAWESQASRTIESTLMERFGNKSRLSGFDVQYDTDPVAISATVLTPQLQPGAESEAEQGLAAKLGRAVDLSLTQYQVGTSASAAEAAQLAEARSTERSAADARQLAKALALVAGVEESEVLVDPAQRRAVARAQAIPGAGLATYRALEQRVVAQLGERGEGWRIELVPPPAALPAIAFDGAEPSEAGSEALALIAWAGTRTGLPVVLSGGTPATRQRALERLGETGVAASGEAGGAQMQARWATPAAM